MGREGRPRRMRKLIDAVQHRYQAVSHRVAGLLGGRRRAWPWFDHAARAFERYRDCFGDRLAAGLTYYSFLSIFPLIALAFAVAGYAVAVDPNAGRHVEEAIGVILPGIASTLPIDEIARAKTGAGVIGLVLLAWAGLGWVGALRGSLRSVWGFDSVTDGSFVIVKLRDALTMILLGTALLVSVGLSGLASSATPTVLSNLGLSHVYGAGLAVRLASLTVAFGTDVAILLVMFTVLSGTRAPWRALARGAVVDAVGLEALKLVGTYLITRTTRNPVYASFA